jgi:hypothetical protein
VFGPPGSDLAANTYALGILRDCLSRLNRVKVHGAIGSALYRTDGDLVHWEIPDVFYPGSSSVDNAESLQALLWCLIECNLFFIGRMRSTGRSVQPLMSTPVFYRRTEVWDAIPALYELGHGDCKSLSAAVVAEHMNDHIECLPCFRWAYRDDGSGELDYHILVQTSQGFTDPSKDKGMGLDEVAKFYPPQ